jgi:hypothetical protein
VERWIHRFLREITMKQSSAALFHLLTLFVSALIMWTIFPHRSRCEEVAPGTTIVSIRCINHDVFDLAHRGALSWPYRLVNALHITTKERLVRSVLLFKENDPLDPGKLAESARLLRRMGFLDPVNITARPVPGGAEVIVETFDEWTTEVSVNYSIFGRRQTGGAEVSEENLLGLGKTLNCSVNYTAVRVTTAFQYADPLLLGSRWRLDSGYQSTSDGYVQSFNLGYPFYSLDTSRAGGCEWGQEHLRSWLWIDGHKKISGESRRRNIRAWYGILLPHTGSTHDRLTLGIFDSMARFDRWRWNDGAPYPDPGGWEMAGPELGWERRTDQWKVVRSFRGWRHQEDIPLGPDWRIRTGLSLPAGTIRGGVFLDGMFTAGVLRGRSYGWVQTDVTGRLERNSARNLLLSLVTGYAVIGKTGCRTRLAVDSGRNLDGDRQLTLGADQGLRGWSPDTFDGTSRAVANFEFRRQITGEVLHVVVLGVTLFADAGRTWEPRVGNDTRGWRGDAGVGMSFETTRSSIARIGRLELGFPDDGGSPVVLLATTSLF